MPEGVADFDALHSRIMGSCFAVACAFDLLMLDGDDLRRRPLKVERKVALRKDSTPHTKAAFNTSNTQKAAVAEMFEAVCKFRGHRFKTDRCAVSLRPV